MSLRVAFAVACLVASARCGVGDARMEVGFAESPEARLPEPAPQPGFDDASAAAPDAGRPALTSVCSSDTFWTSANSGSSRMNPGRACIGCHSSGEGPTFAAGGTVYPTLREPDLCNGLSAVTVELTDAMGVVRTATTNAAGNFSIAGAIALPYRARLLYQGRVRAMGSPQMSGDCNSCHTETGLNGAPGRVMAP